MPAQSGLTLCNSRYCGLPGSSVHGIFQTRIPEWVAISFYRGSSQPLDQTHVSSVSCIGRRVFYQVNHQESMGPLQIHLTLSLTKMSILKVLECNLVKILLFKSFDSLHRFFVSILYKKTK